MFQLQLTAMAARLGPDMAPLAQHVDLRFGEDVEMNYESFGSGLKFSRRVLCEQIGSSSRECLRHLEGRSPTPLARAFSIVGSHRRTNCEFFIPSFNRSEKFQTVK